MNQGRVYRPWWLVMLFGFGASMPVYPLSAQELLRGLGDKVSSFFSSSTQEPVSLADIVNDKKSLLLLDSGKHDVLIYRPFIDSAERAGFKVTYCPVDQFLDSGQRDQLLAQHQAVFFIFTIELLKRMEQSVASKAMLKSLEVYAQRPQVTVGLFFPPTGAMPVNKFTLFGPIFDQAGCLTKVPLDRRREGSFVPDRFQQPFMQAVNQYLCMPFEVRSFKYHTSLNSPRTGTPMLINAVDPEQAAWTPLPFADDHYSEVVKPVYPGFIYWFNSHRRNHLVVGSTTMLSYSGVSECFQCCPLDFAVRHEIDQMIQDGLVQLHGLIIAHNRSGSSVAWSALEPLRERQVTVPAVVEPLREQQTPGLMPRTAWMELHSFEDESKEAEQEKLIDYLLEAPFDAAWLSLSPQMYYSPIARKAADKEKMLQSVSRFTQMLQARATARGVVAPRILLGFELVNNLVEQHLPTNCAFDLYENRYFDIPSPLDAAFWSQEVTDPLAAFVRDWNREEIGHGVVLGGVVFDLEMYGRKTTGSVLSTMGFEPTTFKRFNHEAEAVTTKEVVMGLTAHQQVGHYYEWLEAQAYGLAQSLKTRCSELIPGCAMGVYLPNITIDWFYKGFYRGMCDEGNPFHLYTFNNLFYPYKDYLEGQGIYAYHETVLLLSKLQSLQDCHFIDDALKHHDGVWLNRISRLVDPYKPGEWFTVESTPLSDDDKLSVLRYLGKAQRPTSRKREPFKHQAPVQESVALEERVS